MAAILIEDDYAELPSQDEHKFLHLERVARARLLSSFEDETVGNTEKDILKSHYMHTIVTLAKSFGVDGIAISSSQNTDTNYQNFLLAVSRAQTKIWSASIATFPFGRVTLQDTTRKTILELTSDIEIQINTLSETDRRRARLHKLLEDFRREINQPKTRVGSALTTLAQISTVVAMTTATLAQSPDAYSTIQKLLGAEQLATTAPEIQLIEAEKKLLLPAPPKMIAGPDKSNPK